MTEKLQDNRAQLLRLGQELEKLRRNESGEVENWFLNKPVIRQKTKKAIDDGESTKEILEEADEFALKALKEDLEPLLVAVRPAYQFVCYGHKDLISSVARSPAEVLHAYKRLNKIKIKTDIGMSIKVSLVDLIGCVHDLSAEVNTFGKFTEKDLEEVADGYRFPRSEQ